jgi:hypothetical protein
MRDTEQAGINQVVPLKRIIQKRSFQTKATFLGATLLFLPACGSDLIDPSGNLLFPLDAQPARIYKDTGNTGLNCNRTGVDVARAVTDAARVVALLCESQNVTMAKDGYRRCPTEMCFYESTITDPDNPVLNITINYTDDLGSGDSKSKPGGSASPFPVGGSSPQRLTVTLALTIPLGGPRTSTKCISPIHPSIFTEIQKKTIEELNNAQPTLCE